MSLDITQVVVTAVSTAVATSFSTASTVILLRYFPKILDGIEQTVKVKGREKRG